TSFAITVITNRLYSTVAVAAGWFILGFLFPDFADFLQNSLPHNPFTDMAEDAGQTGRRLLRYELRFVKEMAEEGGESIGSAAGRFGNRALAKFARQFDQLAEMRRGLGLPAAELDTGKVKHTLAKLEIAGQEFYGINGGLSWRRSRTKLR